MKKQFEEKIGKLKEQAKYAEMKEREVHLEEVEEKIRKKEEEMRAQMMSEKKELEQQYLKLRTAYAEKIRKQTDAEIERFENE